MIKILFISLGCDKNLVDTEKMLGLLGREGFAFTDREEEAQVIIVLLEMPRKRVLILCLIWHVIRRKEAVMPFWRRAVWPSATRRKY